MFKKIGTKTDFPENRTTQVIVDGQEICIAHAADNFFAFDDSCTHAHALLSGCDINNGNVDCPLHGAKFSVRTGQALTPPAVEPLKMYEVKTEGDDVLIQI